VVPGEEIGMMAIIMNIKDFVLQLTPKVKITSIVCGTVVLCIFMYLAYQAGVFDIIVRSIFTEVKK